MSAKNVTLVTCEKIRRVLDLDQEVWSQIVGISWKDYARSHMSGQNLPDTAITSICATFNLDEENFRKGAIDIKAVHEYFRGNFEYVPEQYTIGAFSKKRSLIHMMSYIDKYYGISAVESMLRKFQIQYAALYFPDEPINLTLLVGVLEQFSRNGIDDNTIQKMGEYSIYGHKTSPLGEKLVGLTTGQEVFEKIISEHTHFFDRNYDYRIEALTQDFCRIRATPSELAQDLLKTLKPGGHVGCTYKSGVFASFPGFIDLPHVHASEVECIHTGGTACVFDISFKQPFSRALALQS